MELKVQTGACDLIRARYLATPSASVPKKHRHVRHVGVSERLGVVEPCQPRLLSLSARLRLTHSRSRHRLAAPIWGTSLDRSRPKNVCPSVRWPFWPVRICTQWKKAKSVHRSLKTAIALMDRLN